jgi:hypothetical protein
MSVEIIAVMDDEGTVSISYSGEVYLLLALARRIMLDADDMLLTATEDDDDDDEPIKVGFTQ